MLPTIVMRSEQKVLTLIMMLDLPTIMEKEIQLIIILKVQ
jgi:hypothetical protein